MKVPSFNILVLLCVAANIIRLGYEVLKHKKLLVPNRISFVIILTNMLVLWFSWYLLCSLDPSRNTLPTILNYFGLSLFIIGVILFLTALFTIKSLETYSGDLITKGIYSMIRHPMYLALIIYLWCQTFRVVDIIVNIILTIYVIIGTILEEKKLILEFGEAYKQYQKKVPMLIPFTK